METLPGIRNAVRAFIVRNGKVLLLRKDGHPKGERYAKSPYCRSRCVNASLPIQARIRVFTSAQSTEAEDAATQIHL